jgi:hypothetical protein
MEDSGAKCEIRTLLEASDPPDRSRLAKGLASAWPEAEVVENLRAGAVQALDLFVAGDVVGAREQWAKVGGLLTRRPPGKRGAPRLVTHGDRTLTVSAWARELGWSVQALAYRLDVMPQAEALVMREKKA